MKWDDYIFSLPHLLFLKDHINISQPVYTLNADKEVCFTVGMHPATIRELEVAGYLQVWPATVNRCEHTHKYNSKF